MAYQFQAVDNVEPVSDSTFEQVGNQGLYNVVSGCALTYDAADMTVDLAAGVITHNGSIVSVAGGTAAYTLLSNPSNPRWTWLAIDSAGAATQVNGDPAATPSVPELGDNVGVALVYVQAALTVASDATYKIDKRVPAVSQPATDAYKSSTQVFSATTTLADVTSASGTFAFTAPANSVWIADYYLPVSFGGSGGVKFQITGPAAATNVDITGVRTISIADSSADTVIADAPFAAVTAFATNIAAADSSATPGAGVYSNAALTTIRIRLRLINGANAGAVTLQAAQNSANSTTTLAIGSTMTARRIA